MRFPESPIPSYSRYVFGTAFQAGISIFLTVYAWVALLVIFIGGFVPDLGQLNAAGTHWLALVGYGVTQFGTIYIQNERWQSLFRKPAQPQTNTAPRPVASSNVQERREMSKTLAIGRRKYFPQFSQGYAALYKSLERNRWKITRRAVDVEDAAGKVFSNLTENYADTVKEWHRLGFVDGYVTGEPREKWTLNERGREKFAELGNVSTSPTED